MCWADIPGNDIGYIDSILIKSMHYGLMYTLISSLIVIIGIILILLLALIV